VSVPVPVPVPEPVSVPESEDIPTTQVPVDEEDTNIGDYTIPEFEPSSEDIPTTQVPVDEEDTNIGDYTIPEFKPSSEDIPKTTIPTSITKSDEPPRDAPQELITKSVTDDIITGALEKISTGEIFEGEEPVFNPYDVLPWWGWGIVFFLLGVAFLAVIYALFYPVPDKPQPTVVTPIPVVPDPQKIPVPDSSRRMYCLIGEDRGRKVVIRVSDPSLCRKTVLLTDEEYENSL
jgi:hypothetical protein